MSEVPTKNPTPEMMMSAGEEFTSRAARTATGSLTSPVWIVRLLVRREEERPASSRMVVSFEGVRTTVSSMLENVDLGLGERRRTG